MQSHGFQHQKTKDNNEGTVSVMALSFFSIRDYKINDDMAQLVNVFTKISSGKIQIRKDIFSTRYIVIYECRNLTKRLFCYLHR